MDTITLALAASAGTLRVPENRDPIRRNHSRVADAARKRASRDFMRGKLYRFPYPHDPLAADVYQEHMCALIGKSAKVPLWLL